MCLNEKMVAECKTVQIATPVVPNDVTQSQHPGEKGYNSWEIAATRLSCFNVKTNWLVWLDWS